MSKKAEEELAGYNRPAKRPFLPGQRAQRVSAGLSTKATIIDCVPDRHCSTGWSVTFEYDPDAVPKNSNRRYDGWDSAHFEAIDEPRRWVEPRPLRTNVGRLLDGQSGFLHWLDLLSDTQVLHLCAAINKAYHTEQGEFNCAPIEVEAAEKLVNWLSEIAAAKADHEDSLPYEGEEPEIPF